MLSRVRAMPLQPFEGQNINLAQKSGALRFQAMVAQFLNGLLNQVQNGAWLASVLNGSKALENNSLFAVNKDLGTLSSNPTVDCTNAARVYVAAAQGGANRTITLNNLSPWTPVFIYVRTTGTSFLKIAANDPSSNAYTCDAYWGNTASSTPKINLTTTGWNNATSGYDNLFVGFSCTVNGNDYLPFLVFGG